MLITIEAWKLLTVLGASWIGFYMIGWIKGSKLF